MSAETEKKVVRVTTGLKPALYRQHSLVELLSYGDCLGVVERQFHPDGFSCACGSHKRQGHGRSQNNYPRYRCQECGSVYNVLSGTLFSGTTLGPRRLFLFFRLWAAGCSTREIGGEIGLHHSTVRALKQKIEIYQRHQS